MAAVIPNSTQSLPIKDAIISATASAVNAT